MKFKSAMNHIWSRLGRLAAVLIFGGATAVKAATYYFDTNGTDPGFGSANAATASAVWGSLNDGTATPSTVAFATADYLNFGTASLSYAGTVTVSSNIKVTRFNIGSASGAITFSGSTLEPTTVSGAFVNNSASNITINSVIQGNTASVTQSGAGRLVVVGAKTFGTHSSDGGVVTINSGTYNVNTLANAGTASGLGQGTAGNLASRLRFNGGSLEYTGGTVSVNRNFQIYAGGATIEANGAGALTWSGTASYDAAGSARTLTLGGANTADNTFSSALVNNGAGALSVTKSGAGRWILSEANTYTGATSISGGTLALGSGGTSGALNGTASITVASGATLAVNRSDAFSQAVRLNGKAITGDGGFSQIGSCTTTLTVANTYTGPTTISAGTLALGANNVLDSDNHVVMGAATLDMGTYDNALGTLKVTGAATIDLGNGTGELSFLNSSALLADWTGTLTLTGTLGANTLRFGETIGGLHPDQLALIEYEGDPVVIDANGYIAQGGIVWSGMSTTNIADTTAWASATVISNLTSAVLVWAATGSVPGAPFTTNDWPHRLSLGSPNEGPVTGQMTGLTSLTSYTWRLYGENGADNAWSAATVFTTLGAPSVSVLPASAIGVGKATLNGMVTATNGAPLTSVRIYFGDNDGGTNPANWNAFYAFELEQIDVGVAFSTNITGLLYGVPYRYRVYAANAYGGIWSDVESVTTFAVGRVTTADDEIGVSGLVRNDGAASGSFNNTNWMLKNNGDASTFTRKGYVRFGLPPLHETVTNAALELVIHNTELTVDRTNYVYAVTNQVQDLVLLTNGLAWTNAPANNTGSGYAADLSQAVLLGSFVTHVSDTSGTIKSFSNQALVDFLNTDTNDVVTFIVGVFTVNGANFYFRGDTSVTPPALILNVDDPTLDIGIAATTAANITQSSATLRGTLDAEGSVFQVTAYWSTQDNAGSAAWNADGTKGVAVVGTYTNVTGQALSVLASPLSQGTPYFYTFKATTPDGRTTIWAADNGTFETLGATVFRFR